MKKLLLSLVIVLMCVSGVWAANVVDQAKLDQIQQQIQDAMARFDVPGMALVIVEDGQVVYTNGFGVLKKGTDQKVDADTVFQVASVSKNFTALAIMQLQEKGLLKADDLVTTYLPWFASKDAENSKNITIKNLLQHTSGIPTQAYGLEIRNGSMDQLEEQVKRLSKITLTAKPGQRFQYSNMNYWTLSLIVEKVSGMKFADYMQQNVFAPLGMTRTGYVDTMSKVDNLAIGHRFSGGKAHVFDYAVPGTTIAAGGVFTDANDMGKYLIAQMTGTYNGQAILTADGFKALHNDTFQATKMMGYAYGWMKTTVNNDFVYIHHAGDNPNFTADINILPEENVGFMLFANTNHPVTHQVSTNLVRILGGGEPVKIGRTGVEFYAMVASICKLVAIVLMLIGLLWLVLTIVGIQKGKKVIFKGRPGIVRLILQVILVPLIGLAVTYIIYVILPVMMIGSLYIAKLYEHDLVSSLLMLANTLLGFTLFVAIMGFVKKNPKAKLAKHVNTKNA